MGVMGARFSMVASRLNLAALLDDGSFAVGAGEAKRLREAPVDREPAADCELCDGTGVRARVPPSYFDPGDSEACSCVSVRS
jgi:hypothetical protein